MENVESIALRVKARRLTALFFVLLNCIFIGLAQPGGRNFKVTAEGTIVDAKTSEPLFAATVKVTSADGGTGTFGITDSIGHFQFDVERPGKYTLEFSFIGYKSFSKEVNIWPGRGAKLGTFKMEEDATYLKEVETVARSQRVKQVGDTVVYNADAYKVQDGATAEDLVSKMPGIEVTDDGVKAQGETVEKVLVDGKSFFENDPKLALKTLPAEVVQSVAVFDKKSDQSEFTGFDDGNTVKAMDLTTKSYRRNGVFGKVYGGIGNNFDLDHMYWNGGFNLNVFSGDRRISLLGMSNNVNQQNFSFDDLMSSGGMGGGPGGRMAFRTGSRAGVSRANAFALNFNDSYLDDKLEVQGAYNFNNLRTRYENESQTDELLSEGKDGSESSAGASLSNTSRLSHDYNHNFNMRISYKPNDNNEFIFRPSVGIQTSDSHSYGWSESWKSPLDSVLSWDSARRTALRQSSSESLSQSDNTSWNVGGSLVWRHKFNTAGRTLSAEANGRLSGSEQETNTVQDGSLVKNREHFQNTTSDQKNWSAGGNVQYTEALGERSQLSVRYNLNYSRSDRDNLTGWDSAAYLSSVLANDFQTRIDTVDAANSSKYISKNLKQGGELAYRLRNDYVNVMASVNFESSRLEGEQNYLYWEPTKMGDAPNYTTSQTYFSVLPRLRFEWTPVQGTSLNIDYHSNSSAPSVSNLQQSVNTSNKLSYSTGNKDLDQSVSHSVNVRFIHSNMEMATNIMFFGRFSFTQDFIGTQYITNRTDSSTLNLVDLGWISELSAKDKEQYQNLKLGPGASISRPVNMSGYRTATAGLVYGFPFDLLRSNVNVSMNANYTISPSKRLYYNDSTLANVINITSKVRNLSLSPRLHITSNISQDLDFSLEYSPTFQKVKDADNASNSYEYFNQRANGKISWTFWKNFTTEQQVTYTYYGGRSMPSVEDEWIWNMSFGKKFLKQNKAEVKLQIYDVLNTRSGYSRSVSDRSITQSYTNYMPRYFMLTFSYKIANYKSSSAMKERQRGGFGGGFGGPRF